ncbi:MAG: elongation factor Ts [Alphaproteobacteria bacterium PRO2]|nr:elongation factor Ts [Alphaproteobacteria bacterium PRO2]
MADITASMVKELRETTGAGMMDAKNALVETKGDMEAAIDWLRKKGLAKAAKKSGRTAAEGLVAIASEGKTAAVVEINAETDFVSRNEEFQAFVKQVAQIALKADNAEQLAKMDCGGKSVQDTLTDKIATIGENMNLRRSARLSVDKGVVAAYMHSALAPNLGKIGVLVAMESEGKPEVLEATGKQIAMHIAAVNPASLDVSALDPKAIQRERDIFSEQAKASGKPPEIIEKMVEGRLRKFYEEVVLLEQVFVIDGETKISKVLEKAGKDAGAPVKIKAYVRFQIGEGIEVEKEDFAAEVAKAANG